MRCRRMFASLAATRLAARAGTTFGLGFGIRTSPIASWILERPEASAGRDIGARHFWVDPAEQLIGVEMIAGDAGQQGAACAGALTGITSPDL